MRKLLLFLFSHRLLAIARWDIHFLGVRLRNALTGQAHKARLFASTRKAPVLLNLGSGPRGIDDGHWVNVDGYPDKNVQYLIDFNRPLPFADRSFDGVFCEHVLEHFTLEEGERVAKEVFRVLRPGGAFRVIVPDAAWVMEAYFRNPEELIAYRGGHLETGAEAVNLFFRQRYEHQFLYDYITLSRLLERMGFTEIVRAEFGQSSHLPEIAIDDPKYIRESLYVEARKQIEDR
ncbi:MAG: class I SAM-dependent methyltransferase [Acidobacteriota bacterium]